MMTKNAHPAGLNLIPTAVFFVAPALYGIALGLHVAFPIFGARYLLESLITILPVLLLTSSLISGMRLLLSPPRTWAVIFAVVVNFLTTAFALLMSLAAMMMPEPN